MSNYCDSIPALSKTLESSYSTIFPPELTDTLGILVPVHRYLLPVLFSGLADDRKMF